MESVHVNITRHDMQTQRRGRQYHFSAADQYFKKSSHGVSIISDDTDDCDLLPLYRFKEQAR